MTETAHHLVASVSEDQLLAELKRELAQRQRVYDRRVQQGNMTPADRDHQLACAAAWIEDVGRRQDFHARSRAQWKHFTETNGRVGYAVTKMRAAKHSLSWKDRRAALTRELAMRARIYRDRVATGDMERPTADHRIACLQALLEIYDDGFDWLASNGAHPQFASIKSAPAIEQARREWDEHRHAVLARRQPANQGVMAL